MTSPWLATVPEYVAKQEIEELSFHCKNNVSFISVASQRRAIKQQAYDKFCTREMFLTAGQSTDRIKTGLSFGLCSNVSLLSLPRLSIPQVLAEEIGRRRRRPSNLLIILHLAAIPSIRTTARILQAFVFVR